MSGIGDSNAEHPGSYWIHAANLSPGDIVGIRSGPQERFRAEVESIAPDGAVLWTSNSYALPRTLFLRQDHDIWTSNRY